MGYEIKMGIPSGIKHHKVKETQPCNIPQLAVLDVFMILMLQLARYKVSKLAYIDKSESSLTGYWEFKPQDSTNTKLIYGRVFVNTYSLFGPNNLTMLR